MAWRVGIDSGGTFCDICLFEEESGKVAIMLDTCDDIIWRGVKIGAAAMAFEFEFLPMIGHRRQDGLCCFLPILERRGRQDAPHDHTRIHVPWL